jgi:hypothetical protein
MDKVKGKASSLIVNEMKYDNFLVIVKESLQIQVLDASLVDLWERDLLATTLSNQHDIRKCEMRANVRVLPRMTMFHHREQDRKGEKEGNNDRVVTVILVSLSAVVSSAASPCSLFPFQLVAFDVQDGNELWRYEENSSDNEKTKISFDQANVSFSLKESSSSFSIPSIRLPRSSSFYEEIRHHLEKESPEKISSFTSSFSTSHEREGRSTKDWLSLFRTSLLRSGFPHFWRSIHDNRLSLTFIEQDRLVGDGKKSGKNNSNKNKGGMKRNNKGKDNQKKITAEETKRKEIRKKKSLISFSSSSTASSLISSLMSPLNYSFSSSPDNHHHHRLSKMVQPNVAIFHSKEGLRVVALQTGKLLFSLSFEENILYGDLNHDGNIESFLFGLSSNDITTEIVDGKHRLFVSSRKVKQSSNDSLSSPSLNSGGEEEYDEENSCLFSVISGYPIPHSLLFNNADSPLCEKKQENHKRHKAKQRRNSRKYQHLPSVDPSTVTSKITSTPLILHSSPVNLNHRVEHRGDSSFSSNVAVPAFSSSLHSSKDPSRQVSLIVGNNVGLIHGYNSDGQMLWKQNENSFYLPSTAQGTSSSSSSESSTFSPLPYLLEMAPLSISATIRSSLTSSSHKHLLSNNILYVSSQLLRIISSQEGKLLADTHLPYPSVLSPMIVDVDDNGINDIIIITEMAILGYRVEITPSFFPLVIPFLILFFVSLLVFVLKLNSEASSSSTAAIRGSELSGSEKLRREEEERGGSEKVKGKEFLSGGKGEGFFGRWKITRSTDTEHID